MRRILILATAILGIAFPVFAQQGPALPSEDSPQKGSAFPSPGSNRGPRISKVCLPYTIQFNKLGKTSQDPSYDINPRAQYLYDRTRRYR